VLPPGKRHLSSFDFAIESMEELTLEEALTPAIIEKYDAKMTAGNIYSTVN